MAAGSVVCGCIAERIKQVAMHMPKNIKNKLLLLFFFIIVPFFCKDKFLAVKESIKIRKRLKMLTIRLVFLFVFINCYPMDDLEKFVRENLKKQEMVAFKPEESGKSAGGGIIGSLGEALAIEIAKSTFEGNGSGNKGKVMEFELKEIIKPDS